MAGRKYSFNARTTIAAAMVLVLITAGPSVWPIEDVQVGQGTLTSPRDSTAAVWGDGQAYIIGGRDSTGDVLDEIVRYDPVTQETALLDARLPSGRTLTSAVWDGDHIYVFGGQDASLNSLDEIVRVDPDKGSTKTMTATLPSGRAATSAIWDGQNAYVFGGRGPSGTLDEIVRFDPETDTATSVGSLPTPRMVTSAVWNGEHAYIFGGQFGATRYSEVVQYDPETGSATTLGAKLPDERMGTSATWDGQHAYILGGRDSSNNALDEIVRFDPSSGIIEVVQAKLPTARFLTSATWDAQDVHVFGGRDASFDKLDQIVHLSVNEAPVAEIAPVEPKECENGGHEVTLDGTASFDPEGDPLSYQWESEAVALDDPTSPTPSGFFPLGTTPVSLTVTDPFTASDTTSESVEVIDSLPPVTEAAPTGLSGDQGWWRSAVEVTLEADDLCGPVASTEHSVDDGSYTEGTQFTVTGDGTHTARYRSQDTQGNQENDRTLGLKIDETPPDVEIQRPEEGKAYIMDNEAPVDGPLPATVLVGETRIQAEARDETSGVRHVEFHVDNELRGTATQDPYEFIWQTGDEAAGEHELTTVAVDVAGNTATTTIHVTTVATTLEGVKQTCTATGLVPGDICQGP